MIFDWTIPLIAAITALGLGMAVARTATSRQTRLAFLLLSVTLFLWNVNFVILYGVEDYQLTWFLTRITRNGAMLLPATILQFSLAVTARQSRSWRTVLIADYAYGIALCFINNLDRLVIDLGRSHWGYYTIGGPFYHLFTASVVLNFILATLILVRAYRTTTDSRLRLQLRFWMIGLVVAVPLGLTNLLPPYGIPIYPLGSLGSAAWVAIVAYAIVKHRVVDVHVAVTKGIAYAGVLLVVVVPAFAFMVMIQRLAFGEVHYDFSAALLIVLVAVGVAFPWLQRRAELEVGRSLFREHYEKRLELDRFGRKIVRILDRNELIASLCRTLARIFETDAVTLFLAQSSDTSRLALAHFEGPSPATTLLSGTDLSVPLARREALLRDEVTDAGESGRTLSRLLSENGWEVCVPLVGEGMLGVLLLGSRRQLEAYAAGDLDLLNIVATQATIALENARLYGELKKSQEVIRRTGRLSAIGTLAAGIAHEIRNPLVSIQTFFQLAPARVNDEEFLTSFLRLTESEVKRICDLITDLLNFARSPSHTLSRIDLNQEVEKCLALLVPQARNQHVDVEVAFSASLPPIAGDADQLQQVFINIVLNAIQASPRGGRVLVSTEPSELDGREYSVVSVSDRGSGIPEHLREDIFNPFFTTKSKGTGLGLAVSHQIVKEHGGVISVENGEGGGTVFRVHLPANRADEDIGPDVAPSPVELGRPQGRFVA